MGTVDPTGLYFRADICAQSRHGNRNGHVDRSAIARISPRDRGLAYASGSLASNRHRHSRRRRDRLRYSDSDRARRVFYVRVEFEAGSEREVWSGRACPPPLAAKRRKNAAHGASRG
jgi:hypothetical protein